MPAGSAFSSLQTSGRMIPGMGTRVPFEEQSYARTTIKNQRHEEESAWRHQNLRTEVLSRRLHPPNRPPLQPAQHQRLPCIPIRRSTMSRVPRSPLKRGKRRRIPARTHRPGGLGADHHYLHGQWQGRRLGLSHRITARRAGCGRHRRQERQVRRHRSERRPEDSRGRGWIAARCEQTS